MAQKIPDPLSRRHLLEGGVDAAKASALAEAYLAAGREIEAVDFLALAGARDGLVALQQQAIERGDVFLLRAANRGLSEEGSSDQWKALRESALRRGRELDAETAKRLATVEGPG
ncbi:MAG: hypothetical protein CL908_18150 [Deltaproteobacteria bacterium]|nr:hypothetical protein [Deltaproteobacteria bacterium]